MDEPDAAEVEEVTLEPEFTLTGTVAGRAVVEVEEPEVEEELKEGEEPVVHVEVEIEGALG